MPGEQLMCVWEAVWAEDLESSTVPSTELIRQVTSSIYHNDTSLYEETKFNEYFQENTVTFADYKEYMNATFENKACSLQMAFDKIEQQCWEKCKTTYQMPARQCNETTIANLWTIYIRMTEAGSYPPRMTCVDAEWIFDKLTLANHRFSENGNVTNENEGYTFKDFLNTLEKVYFKNHRKEDIDDLVEELHDWLVKEISMVGWLYKRTRKLSNWTSWSKRWFVLYPGKLEYYETPSCKYLKGEITITNNSQLDLLPGRKGPFFGKTFKYGFRLSNYPYMEIDMSAGSIKDREAWMTYIAEIVEAAQLGLTPIKALLKDRSKTIFKSGQRTSSDQETEKKLNSYQLSVKKRRESMKDIGAVKDMVTSDITSLHPPVVSDSDSTDDECKEDNEICDNNVYAIQRNKIRIVFNQFDKDGNGYIESTEFIEFIKGLGLVNMSNEEINFVFKLADTDNDGKLSLEEFMEYFNKFVMEENGSQDSMIESKLRTAFLKADEDGQGTVDFREFINFAMEQNRSVRIGRIIDAFQKIDKSNKGEISYDQFRAFFQKDKELALIPEGGTNISEPVAPGHEPCSLEQYLRNMYTGSKEEDLVEYIHSRWKKFVSFKRYGASGELVMEGDIGMVADILPGKYTLVDLACFSDLPQLRPRHASAKGVTWVSSTLPGKSGKCIFPPDYDGHVPVDIATNEHLRYYGCSLADSNQVQVSLLYRHGIQDFTYQNQYLEDYVKTQNGGAGLEKHEFTHLDCPLVNDSGYFILAKFDEESGEFHITGFKVPARHTLYVPGGVIHSNDYLTGTWRTMLSDEAEIDHVHLTKKNKRDDDKENLDQFVFNFQKMIM